jgi:hypothetical protein
MHKALAQMHGQLTEVVRDITGKTGMTLLRLLLAGERDAATLATHRDPRCKRDRATLVQALQGTWRQAQVLALEQAAARDDFLQAQIIACDQQIEA